MDGHVRAGRIIIPVILPGFIAVARAGDPPFDGEDPVHQVIDGLRWAENIRDARAARDFRTADRVRATASMFGAVSILKSGTVVVGDFPGDFSAAAISAEMKTAIDGLAP